jgi:hypothetical protein
MQSLLADFVNHRLEPDIPLPVACEPDGSMLDMVKAPLPGIAEFEPDSASPYLAKIAFKGTEVTLVTGGKLTDFASTIGIKQTASFEFHRCLRSSLLLYVRILPRRGTV